MSDKDDAFTMEKGVERKCDKCKKKYIPSFYFNQLIEKGKILIVCEECFNEKPKKE